MDWIFEKIFPNHVNVKDDRRGAAIDLMYFLSVIFSLGTITFLILGAFFAGREYLASMILGGYTIYYYGMARLGAHFE